MSPAVLLLVLYPIVETSAPSIFFLLWPRRRPSGLDPDAVTNAGKAATVRLGALVSLFTSVALMCGTLLWWLLFPIEPGETMGHALSGALAGAYFGLSWAGVSVWLLALGAATGRMRREIPGLMAPLKVQTAVWSTDALAEETWRITAILALITSRISPLTSVMLVSV